MPLLLLIVRAQTLQRKLKQGLCLTPFCRRKARHQRHRCCTCQDRKWRKNNPLRYLLKNLRGHAKERKIDFSLTFEQWVGFCHKTSYHLLVGQKADSATVDRRDPSQGYHIDNIRVRTHATNSADNGCYTPEEDPFS